MTQADKINIVKALQDSGMKIENFIVEMNGNINNYGENRREKERNACKITLEGIGRVVEKCKPYFWASSSIAVVFCVCRDYCDYPDNMSQFERDYSIIVEKGITTFTCAPGTIASTFFNNDYMKLPIDKWQKAGAKSRVLQLVGKCKECILMEEQRANP